MSKRFHDTEIWKQDWFLELPDEYRTLWIWIKDTCDHAGIWKPNKKLLELLTGKPIDLKKALLLFNNYEKQRIRPLENGRWFLEDFISFQYGNHLNPNNRVHSSILSVLDKNGVKLTSIRGLFEVKHRVKEKDKDKDNIETNPEIKIFIDFWHTKYLAKHGIKYVFHGAKEGQLVKTMLKSIPLDEVKKRADAFFESKDKFIEEAGHTIGVFSSQINKLSKQSEVKHGLPKLKPLV